MTDPDPCPPPHIISEPNIHIELTHSALDIPTVISHVKSPKAGAIVLFAGTTRDTFQTHRVHSLTYTSYAPLALLTLQRIAHQTLKTHSLTSISITHRLGTVPIGEESILIAVSAPHRQAAWRAGEEALEECKRRVEVWKCEVFEGEEGGVWRANADGGVAGNNEAKRSVKEGVGV
ncbi:MAG: Molybdopterin synthase catalytic subunit [Candelina mexicana]|nr:MAG: Molybdopterin synthase catalytic subunit [Candelina mexicana]